MNVRNEEENGILALKILKIICGQNLENGPKAIMSFGTSNRSWMNFDHRFEKEFEV